MIKRFLDIVLAAAGLVLLSPLLLFCFLAVKLTSPGPALFRQQRVGRDFRAFEILKFRSMVDNAAALGSPVTIGDDPRITRVGKLLRSCKLDELPQLANVLKGDMSVVGPRPESPCYVDMFRDDYAQILTVRPGMTDVASLKYRDESACLARFEDPDRAYVQHVLPDKIELAKQYVRQSSVLFDLKLILQTVLVLCADPVLATGKNARPTDHVQ